MIDKKTQIETEKLYRRDYHLDIHFFVLCSFLAVVIFVGSLLFFFYNTEKEVRLNRLVQEASVGLASTEEQLVSDFKGVILDLKFLTQVPELNAFIDHNQDRKQFANELKALITAKQIYDQIRIIDNSGMELIRVDYNDGKPIIVEDSKLQNKASRYYFKQTNKLSYGEIYISPLDLNIEHGVVERPYKPVIRFGTKLYGEDGLQHGVLIINYIADSLLNRIKKDTQSLLNRDGYWLIGGKDNDFAFMFGRDDTFGKINPECWKIICTKRKGIYQDHFRLIVFNRFSPWDKFEKFTCKRSADCTVCTREVINESKSATANDYWILMNTVDYPLSRAGLLLLKGKLVILFAVFCIISAIAAYMIDKLFLRRRQADSHFKILFTQSLNPYLLMVGSRIVERNLAAVMMFGESRQNTILGKSFFKDLSPATQENGRSSNSQEEELLNSTLMKGSTHFDWVLKKLNGTTFNVEVRLTIFPEKRDGSYTYLAVLHDVTERIKNLKQLSQAKERAEEAVRSKSEFIANISHEIRTPLNAIIGFSSLMTEKQSSSEKLTHYLDAIQGSGQSLLTLFNDILDLSKIESGKLRIEYKPFATQRIFNEMKQLFNTKLVEKNVDFILDVAPDIPREVCLDETRLRQILMNLIGNAIKFTAEGFVKLSAKAEFIPDDPKRINLVFIVEDTGIGIPPDQQERIFGAFEQRIGQSHATYGGTGLGLAISKRLVEMMNGSIFVCSEEGKGSIFYVILNKVAMLPATMDETHSTFESYQSQMKKTGSSSNKDDVDLLSIDDIEGLVASLKDECEGRYSDLRDTLLMNETRDFAVMLQELGEKHHYPNLSTCGKRLFEEVDSFDVDAIPKTLDEFHKMFDKLKASV